jgi:hypothetical protein
MFRAVPLSVIRSFSLYTQPWYMSYRFADSCSQLTANLYDVHHLLCLQWKTPDDGQRNCPKNVEFHSKNKFEKLVHLVGFTVRNLSLCTVTWTSNLWYFVFVDSLKMEVRCRNICYGDHLRKRRYEKWLCLNYYDWQIEKKGTILQNGGGG